MESELEHQSSNPTISTGKLDASISTSIDHRIAAIDPYLSIDRDPRAHQHLRPEQMVLREELRQAKTQTLAVRRVALRKLLLEDFMQEDRELRGMGLAYARSGL